MSATASSAKPSFKSYCSAMRLGIIGLRSVTVARVWRSSPRSPYPWAVGVSRRRLLLGPSEEFVERRTERLPPLREVILDLRRDFSVHNARNDSVPSSCRSCWVSIFCEMPAIARSRSEKRSVLPPKRWKRMTSFQRPSTLRMACSIPAAADAGVCARLLTGASLTFECVLAASARSRYVVPRCRHMPTRQFTYLRPSRPISPQTRLTPTR